MGKPIGSIGCNQLNMKVDRDSLAAVFLENAGWGGARRLPLAADASFRSYERVMKGGHRAVLMNAPPPEEDVRGFSRIARHLLKHGYSAPRIFAEDSDLGFMLLEDLGDDTFASLLDRGVNEDELYLLATDFLIELHSQGSAVILRELPEYSQDFLLQEAELFTSWYLPEIFGAPLSESAKQSYLIAWKSVLTNALKVPSTMVLRDFHVDNLIRLDERPGFAACGLLDFQDALVGPITYDLVSLLEDARRDVSKTIQTEMKIHYLRCFPLLDEDTFLGSMAVLGAQRHAKVIGIFARLFRRDGKPNYIKHIPRVWSLLENCCLHPNLEPIKIWLDTRVPVELRVAPRSLVR
ncbi:MAG: phosphotransferase [Rhodospirillaceae bacterium]